MIVDSSAVAALVLGEPGAGEVERQIEGAAISSVNFSEAIALFARKGMSAERIYQLLDPLDLTVIDFDRARARAAGLLAPLTQRAGLSLGDRACLALARERDEPALTGDRAWLRVADDVRVDVRLFR